MITIEDIKNNFGDGINLLFKGQSPFVEIEKGIPGGVIIENEEHKILCNICKKWFHQIAFHIRAHGISAKEYRERFGLNADTALCSKIFSRKMSEISSKLWQENREEKIEKIRQVGKMKIGRPKGAKKTLQEKNRMNTCEEQIKVRMEMLVIKFGAEISLTKVRKVDSGLAAYAYRHYGSWNNFVQLFGIEPDISSKKKEISELIYSLREYVADYEKLPWNRLGITDPAFPHSKTPYLTEFGSIIKTYKICGIKLVRRMRKKATAILIN